MAAASSAPGSTDLERRIDTLSDRLTDGLKPLAAVAYNYRWSWSQDGADVFSAISEYRWERSGHNPVRFLNNLWPTAQERAEQDAALVGRIRELADLVAADVGRPDRPRPSIGGPVAFFSSEFGVHESLPLYSLSLIHI